jgi:hypothetical protein
MVTKQQPGTRNNRQYFVEDLEVLRNKIYEDTGDQFNVNQSVKSKCDYFQINSNLATKRIMHRRRPLKTIDLRNIFNRKEHDHHGDQTN